VKSLENAEENSEEIGTYRRKSTYFSCIIFIILSLFNLLFFHNFPFFSLFNKRYEKYGRKVS
jgi:hypothetical protein